MKNQIFDAKWLKIYFFDLLYVFITNLTFHTVTVKTDSAFAFQTVSLDMIPRTAEVNVCQL